MIGEVAVVDLGDYDDTEAVEAIAADKGCNVVYLAPDQLQVDIDSEESFAIFMKRIEEVQKRIDSVLEVSIKPSKSGLPNRHITITRPGHKFTEWEQIAIQFALGSDPIRETMNVLRVLSGHKCPTRFFELKEKTCVDHHPV